MVLEMFEEARPILLKNLESRYLAQGETEKKYLQTQKFIVIATSALAKQQNNVKKKKKRGVKKVEVTDEMVTEADKHAAELLEMFDVDEDAADSGDKSGSKKSGKKQQEQDI